MVSPMRGRGNRTALVMVAGVVALGAAARVGAAPDLPPDWPGDELPLPIAVKSAADLAFKNEAERQFLIFNLMTVGKRAFEAGDYARAARKWEALLKMPGIPADVERAVRPLLDDAQQAAASGAAPVARPAVPAAPGAPAAGAPAAGAPVVVAPGTTAAVAPPVPELADVSGTV